MNRFPRPFMSVLLLAGSLTLPLSAQETANPLSGCFRVSVEPSAPDADPESHVVEFVFEPSHAWETGYERTWSLSESTDAKSVAFWWIEEEQLVAIWPIAEEILTLRLVPSGSGLVGLATPTLTPREESRRVEVQPANCPGKSG